MIFHTKNTKRSFLCHIFLLGAHVKRSVVFYYYYVMAAKSQKRSWTDEVVENRLIRCLLDVYSKAKTYHKRELRETLDVSVNEIKAKWNSLRAYYGKELAKVNGTKSGHKQTRSTNV